MNPLEMALDMYVDALRDVFGETSRPGAYREELCKALMQKGDIRPRMRRFVRDQGCDPDCGLGAYLVSAAETVQRNVACLQEGENVLLQRGDIHILDRGFRVGNYSTDRDAPRRTALALLLERGEVSVGDIRGCTGWNGTIGANMRELTMIVRAHSRTHELESRVDRAGHHARLRGYALVPRRPAALSSTAG